MTDEIKKAEKRGYAKGYRAGKRRQKADRSQENWSRYRDALWNRAFLTALNATIQAGGWKLGDKPCRNSEDYTTLAARFADRAVKVMR